MKFLLALALTFLVTAPAFAAQACYSPAEQEAEHVLRLHSELMVITVTCRYSSDNRPLVPAYSSFTQKHLDKIKDAEKTLVAYYKKNGSKNAVDKLDQLRTRLGNEIGQQVADVSAPAFCDQRRDKVLDFAQASNDDVSRSLDVLKVSSKTIVPACSFKTASKGK